MNKTLILSIAFTLLSCMMHAKEQYTYSTISHNEGLTSTVNSIYKEKDGDVWIGTPNGLYSFNGYSLKHHTDTLFEKRKVFSTSMDKDGTLWVLTDKRIILKNSGSTAFRKLNIPEAAGEQPFYSMLHDKDGIWIGGEGVIYRYTYSDRKIRFFCTTKEHFESRTMGLIDENTLLCGSDDGQVRINLKTKELSDVSYGSFQEVTAIHVDSQERIWIAFYNNGIEVFHKNGTKIRSYNTGNSALSNNIILCMTEHDGKILAGTDGGGINIINPDTEKITVLSNISGDPYSLPAHSIESIFIDQYGSIWAGSTRNGLICMSRSGIKSHKDTHIGLTNGLSYKSVLCLYQDADEDCIWIGTDGEGINRYDPAKRIFTHYKTTLKSRIVSIAGYSKEELAVSTHADNIYLFNKKTGRLRPLNINNPEVIYQIKYTGKTVSLYNEAGGDLLLVGKAINRYDSNSRQCLAVKCPEDYRWAGSFYLIGKDKDGVWFHDRYGIYFLQSGSMQLIRKGTHQHHQIRSGHLAADGTIWLATEEGLCSFSTADSTFGHIKTTLFSEAVSVIADRNSRVWVGTEGGLFAYLTESETFALFGESDGALQNEYYNRSRLLANNGDVYMGGIQGLTQIDSDHKIETEEIPAVKLHEIITDGESVPLPGNHTYRLSRNNKRMKVSISVQEKDMFRQKIYSFSLSSGETYVTKTPELSLKQLPSPGTYDLYASCTKRTGEWTSPVKLMTFVVPQPWFLSWWFFAGCLLAIILAFTIILIANNIRKSNELKMAIKEQEQKVYEEKVNMLINISHELRTPLTLIMAPLKRLLKNMDPEQEEMTTLVRVYRQSRRMKNLLDMVLDLRKLEIGEKTLKCEKVEFNRWIEDVTEDIVNEEKAEGIDITYSLDNQIGYVDTDQKKCETILTNILINAIKHSSAGDTITISTQLTEDGMIRTSVSDQGAGLSHDIDLSKIFMRFYQSNNERYGSGIGLSYAKILVEMHGGSIGVQNNPDKGATFWWEIPVETSVSETNYESKAFLNELLGHNSEADMLVQDKEEFSTAGMKIMVVDDNPDLLEFLREALCHDFAEIITVAGGHQAFRMLKEGKLPDIVVSDVNMPDGDGYSLCNDIKNSEDLQHIPVVLLTARGEEQSQSDSYRLGADGFLAKPFEIETLTEMIRNILRGKSEIRKRYFDKEEMAESEYGSNEEKFILQFNKIIADNLSNPDLDQQLICREMGVSRALLYNKMKAITGAGAKEYITKIRIEKAKTLIETTQLTIAEISDMTGFTSQSYFSTAFKSHTGSTPSQYKSLFREKNQ